jgi:hypothetical protein
VRLLTPGLVSGWRSSLPSHWGHGRLRATRDLGVVGHMAGCASFGGLRNSKVRMVGHYGGYGLGL